MRLFVAATRLHVHVRAATGAERARACSVRPRVSHVTVSGDSARARVAHVSALQEAEVSEHAVRRQDTRRQNYLPVSAKFTATRTFTLLNSAYKCIHTSLWNILYLHVSVERNLHWHYEYCPVLDSPITHVFQIMIFFRIANIF